MLDRPATSAVGGLALMVLDGLELRLFDELALRVVVAMVEVGELDVAADEVESALLEKTELLYGDGKMVTV